MVTGATLYKQHHFRTPQALDLLLELLLQKAERFDWDLQAWAVFSNHYHFVAHSPDKPETLATMLGELHSDSARALNEIDGTPGRRVWFQFWETHLSFQRSYFSRLRYVHENPVRHHLVLGATQYPWCSAGWFEEKAKPSFRRTVQSFKTDRVNVLDDYEPVMPAGI